MRPLALVFFCLATPGLFLHAAVPSLDPLQSLSILLSPKSQRHFLGPLRKLLLKTKALKAADGASWNLRSQLTSLTTPDDLLSSPGRAERTLQKVNIVRHVGRVLELMTLDDEELEGDDSIRSYYACEYRLLVQTSDNQTTIAVLPPKNTNVMDDCRKLVSNVSASDFIYEPSLLVSREIVSLLMKASILKNNSSLFFTGHGISGAIASLASLTIDGSLEPYGVPKPVGLDGIETKSVTLGAPKVIRPKGSVKKEDIERWNCSNVIYGDDILPRLTTRALSELRSQCGGKPAGEKGKVIFSVLRLRSQVHQVLSPSSITPT